VSPQTIDLLVSAFVALAALIGFGIGGLRAASGLVATAVVVTLMLLGYLPLVTLLGRFPDLNPRLATIIAFGLLALVGQVLATLAIQRPLDPLLRAVRRHTLTRRLDRLLGLVPGALAGGLIASLVLAPLAVATPGLSLAGALRDTRLAATLLEWDARVLQTAQVRPLLQAAADTLTLPSVSAQHEEARDLPFRLEAGELAPDPEAEAQLLALVNGEREAAGLPALALDETLVPVGRAHATEMFEQGYFAHESPTTGDPFDRLAAAQITYLAAGENLAFAPDLLTAHRGLMNSPGHRANILSPAFGRAGMAVIRSRYHGLMIVQMFRD
jgi:uncharacterized protein YkwD/uncharacterized membrane protein required for colicin V production